MKTLFKLVPDLIENYPLITGIVENLNFKPMIDIAFQ